MKISTCCGADLWLSEDPICSQCMEHCDYEIIDEDDFEEETDEPSK